MTNGGALGLNGAAPVSISSDSLKDIVPDLKPLLDTTVPAISDDQGRVEPNTRVLFPLAYSG